MEEDDYKLFLKHFVELQDGHIALLKKYLTDGRLRQISEEFMQSHSAQEDECLNVFKIISDLYYRENFHRDIIYHFLNPHESHGAGNKFLFLFIDLINSIRQGKQPIVKSDYAHVRLTRETDNRIDTLIRAEKHCIIIENKMYNASDTSRQLPKYYDYCTQELGLTVDAIVYIPMDPHKRPDQTGWSAEDKTHVAELFCLLPAYHKGLPNLVDEWITPCAHATNDIHCIAILKQYANLIKSLSKDIMDDLTLDKFHDMLISENCLETAVSTHNLLDEMPAHMTKRLRHRFLQWDGAYEKPSRGMYEVWSWKPQHCGIAFDKKDYEYKIDIWSSLNGYEILVFAQSKQDSSRDISWAEKMTTFGKHNFTRLDSNEYKKNGLSFYDENQVVACVRDVLTEMEEVMKGIE